MKKALVRDTAHFWAHARNTRSDRLCETSCRAEPYFFDDAEAQRLGGCLRAARSRFSEEAAFRVFSLLTSVEAGNGTVITHDPCPHFARLPFAVVEGDVGGVVGLAHFLRLLWLKKG